MNQYLIDSIVDHYNWIRYIRPRKLCYNYDTTMERYGLDDIIVLCSENYYKYSAEIYLSYYIYLMVLKE